MARSGTRAFAQVDRQLRKPMHLGERPPNGIAISLAHFCLFVVISPRTLPNKGGEMSQQITVKQARELFAAGLLSRFTIARDPLQSDGWVLQIESTNGFRWTLETARGDVRVFSTLDAVEATLRQIGAKVDYLTVGRG